MDTSIGVIFIVVGIVAIVLSILVLFSKYSKWLNKVEEIPQPVRNNIDRETICKTVPTTPTTPKIQNFVLD